MRSWRIIKGEARDIRGEECFLTLITSIIDGALASRAMRMGKFHWLIRWTHRSSSIPEAIAIDEPNPKATSPRDVASD
jgi:hypothetical protein